MPAPRRTVSLLAALLGTATLVAAAPTAHAGSRRAPAPPAPAAHDLGAEAEPAPPRARKPQADPPGPAAASVDPPRQASKPVPKASRRKPAAPPVPKASKPAPPSKSAGTPPDPRSGPTTARNPAADSPPDARNPPQTTARNPAAAGPPDPSKPARTAARKPAAGPPDADPPVPATRKPADPRKLPASTLAAPGKPATRPLRPRREPLLARHPAASCALDPLEAVGLGQHGRARDSLREFYWSDMARFFETSVDLAEPVPQQVDDPAFLATETVLRELPASVRTPLATIAGARVVDRLGEREFNKVSKLLASLSPAQVAGLLRADSPTLRAYVWTWLATTRTGGCHLGHLDPDFIEAAVGDRSVAVEHGDDLVYRSLGDYALAARARLATLDPARFDAFLVRLTTAGEIDPLARATAHGILLRRGHWDTLALGLRDASPPVRAATAAAAIEMNRDKVEPEMLTHAASDPADLVTEQIVGALLGVYDPHTHGRPHLRGPLASTQDDRLTATVARWRGRGDASEPLPAPARPLRFVAAPVPADMSPTPAPAAPQAAPADGHTADARLGALDPRPVPADSRPVPADSRPVPTDSRPATPSREPRPLPSILDPIDDGADTGDLDELDTPSPRGPARP